MSGNKGRRTAWLLAFWMAVGCVGAARAAGPAEKPATKPSGSIAGYYGFGEMEILKLERGLGRPIIADINHDGLNDLIVTNNSKARIELLLQKKDFKPSEEVVPIGEDEDINDIFGKELTWRFKRASYDLDVGAISCVVADLNGDARLDLAYYAQTGLYVALQEPPQKPKGPEKDAGPVEPAWSAPRKIDLLGGLALERALACGDLNGDGRADLALLAGDGTFLLHQKPDGTLEKAVKYHTSGRNFRQLDVADLDGDKRADLILLTSDKDFPLHVRFQTPGGKLGAEVRLRVPMPSVLEPARLGPSARSHVFMVEAHSGRVGLWALRPATRDKAHPVYTYPLPETASAGDRDTIAADVDGDGRLDVVVSDPARAEFLLFRARPGVSLAPAEEFPGLMDMRKLCAGRLDEADKDAVVVLSVKEKLIAITRLTEGRLSFPASVDIEGEPLAMALADVNGDGRLDLVYVALDREKKKHFLRTVLHLGREQAKPGPTLELTELKDKPLDLRAADVDHDGRPDALIVRPYGPLLLARQKADGAFEQVTGPDVHAGLVAEVFPSNLSIGPLGPGGKPAALLAQKRFARALWFDPAKGWQVIDQYPAPNPQSNLAAAAAYRAGDDGPVTIVAYDAAREKLGILSRQADGTYRTTTEVQVGAISARKVLAGDFGGRTRWSLLVCGARKLVRVPLAERPDELAKLASFEPDIKEGRFGALTVGDVNSDDLPDVVLLEQARHHVQILTFNPAGRLVAATKFKVFEQPRDMEREHFLEDRRKGGEPRAAVVGDVTGDAKADLVLLVHDRLIVYPQD